MEFATLNDGHYMPVVGLGTFQGNYDFTCNKSTVVNAVKTAVDVGYRHFDTAANYRTEDGLGEALAELFNSKLIARPDVFVTTKLWCTKHRREDVVPSLRTSLSTLGLQYVDLFLIHWPIALKPGDEMWPKDDDGKVIYADDTIPFTETWQGMIECQKLGLARSIGVSNFNRRQLQTLFESSSVKPAVNQVEVHPFFSNARLVDFCQQNDILVTCYSPLGKPTRPWARKDEPVVAKDATLNEIAAKYNKTASQVALRLQIQRGLGIIPKSNSVDHQRDNISIFDFNLSDEDMTEIMSKCNRDFRVLQLKHLFGDSKEYPFSDEY